MREFIGNEITYLLPGELIVSDQPMKISTVLGSCISVCMNYRETHLAAMNHFVLPSNATNDPKRLRYGDTSLEEMLVRMIKLGAKKNRIDAEVFGGSAMFASGSHSFRVGERNTEAALNFLKNNSIYISNIQTGGNTGRKVIFDTSAGIISCTLLKQVEK
jgi:chemotaxis protein CheD